MRSAIRTLRSPLGAVVAVTIAVATAACSLVGALLDAALFRPPPFPDAARLAILYRTHQSAAGGLERERWSYRRFLLLRDAVQPSLFSDVASFSRSATLTLTGDGSGDPEPMDAEVVSTGYFHTLDVHPRIGVLFSAEESDKSLTRAEVVIGYGLWKRYFAGDSGIVGKRVVINGLPFSVTGVLPPGFAGLTGRSELWIRPGMAVAVSYAGYLETNQNFISVVGRLAPGVTLASAATALDGIGASIDRMAPGARYRTGDRFAATALSLNDARVDSRERQWVLLLVGAVTLLFLLACANVMNLLLARSLGRRRELAVRSALGATRWQLVRETFIEGATLALTGGAFGGLIALLLVPWLGLPARMIAPRNMYGSIGAFADPRADARFVTVAISVSILATFLCALVPALLPQRLDLTRDLKDGAPNVTLAASPRRLTARSLMVMLETALALVLLVAGGLMTESYRRLRAMPLGFNPQRILTFWIRPSEVQYPPWRAPLLIDQVLTEIERVPGVAAATVDGCTPVSTGCANTTLYVSGRPQPRPQDAPPVLRHYVAPEHFATLGIPLLRGRIFTDDDRAGSRRVAIINRLAADRFFPNEDPIGKRVWFGGGSNFDRPDSAAEIVGIVGNVAYQSLDERPVQPDFYTSYRQFTYATRVVMVRSLGDPAALVPAMRRAVRRVNPGLALYEVRTMDGVIGDASAGRRFDTVLLSAFAVVAVALAAMGIYGVVAHSVAQRTREVGIRIALGATARDVIALVVREGMALPTIGLIIGVLASAAFTRVLRSALYGVSSTNPLVYGVLGLTLACVGILACYVPARRAARVDPLVALNT
ncbi:MAG TPA: ABC transporter permease [Gemmatimonadaceae bacterium]|nr:ABC transporter permease [Gemmatimonadaceae bacterium]